ncbi:TIGR02677 family protein [Ohessyouella blattaphilus]|uniref:TIGR02677 family protein n=1 Tax=Ohessyouella blattaphilus TaxID=2949333 RepID=A0ABT1EIR7_9FIRM|nr:TIGR02677 family protein [Ohessyouella blattaphilus]MCP1109576.1 TIGR02677 family protein [Ohessyouella blattaphilus]MCR8562970.1 TIGR02677 family protein [Ohessyouella blattaphilus]MDL2250581.1 TIGR02677 family protein [Lachnospiraceae bacterium OttesenSCG-928-J05]
MQRGEEIRKPITEAKYLNVENTDRYRSIIRLFYLQYEKLKYWLYAEEVFAEIKEDDYFADYTLEQCQQDLQVLREWKNLLAMQDTKKVSTIEEFKNKKFRYQLSEFSVEVERMVIRLENLQIEGTSLEPTLLERLRKGLGRIAEMSELNPDEVYGWWSELNNNFVLLNQNYQDYMRDLNSLKAEEMMKTKAFLLFKDTLIEYLRGFVKSLQYNMGIIESELKDVSEETLKQVFAKILTHELSIPRLDFQINEEEMAERIFGRFASIRNWFLGENGRPAEAEMVFDLANNIIRKITRYATQISEQTGGNANRRSEYLKLAEIFGKCNDITQAHELSSMVFGFEGVMHLKGDFKRSTESMNSGVYEEEAEIIKLAPRTRVYRERSEKSPVVDHSKEKEMAKEAVLQRIEMERKLLRSYIKDGVLEFKDLPVIKPEVRDTFLTWLSKAMENDDFKGKTEDGEEFAVKKPDEGEYCQLQCTDGEFLMPAYRIEFVEGVK